MSKFVTTFNGARDRYSLPLALHESELLACHVTDFLIPNSIARMPGIRSIRISGRSCVGLPFSLIHVSARAMLLNARLRLRKAAAPGRDRYFDIDRTLSLAAARAAERLEANLFLHSGCAFWAFQRLPHVRKLLFQFHPHPAVSFDVLRADFEAHPEVAWSFAHEDDSRPPANYLKERTDEWRLADRVVCASSFTKRSLIYLGFSADQITVTPYGIDAPASFEPQPRNDHRCRFLFVGQGVQRKGLHHLLKAWRHARTGDDELVIVARRIDPGITPLLDQPGVVYVAGASADNLDALFARSDIFVMPSLVEGFGLVYGEALARGLHCIGTHNTGLPDYRLGPEEVTLAEAGNVEDLVRCLGRTRQLWRDGGLSKSRIREVSSAQTWELHRRALQEFARHGTGKD